MERAAKKAAEEWRGKRSGKSTTDLEQQRRCPQGPEQGSARSKHPGDVLQRPAAPQSPPAPGDATHREQRQLLRRCCPRAPWWLGCDLGSSGKRCSHCPWKCSENHAGVLRAVVWWWPWQGWVNGWAQQSQRAFPVK